MMYETAIRHESRADAQIRLRAQRSPTIVDLAWAAGFLEGEGNFQYYQSHEATRTAVRAAQVNREPLDRLVEIFGGAVYSGKPLPQHSPFWNWQITGARGRGVMMTLYSLMSEKRKAQIYMALATWRDHASV